MGRAINQRLNQQALKQVFAAFLILLGGFVIVREGSKLLAVDKDRPPAAHSAISDQTSDLSFGSFAGDPVKT